MIPHSKVVLEDSDLDSVIRVLRSGQLAQGKVVSSFEKKMAALVGVDNAVAVSSGTAALHLSLLALGVGKGDQVVLPSYVCTAVLNAVNYVMATPVLVDVDPDTYNIRVENIKDVISDRTKAIIVPHMFGLPADVDSIVPLGVPVIEDCAHCVGARLKDGYTGSFGLVSVFSFYATKMLGAGEGGMVLSTVPDLAEKIRDMRAYDERQTYSLRYNYKLTDIHASLAASQLKKLHRFIKKRQKIASIYNAGLEGMVSRIPTAEDGKEHVYYRYVIPVDDPMRFVEKMKKKGIECRKPVFKPLHRYLRLAGYPMTDYVWEKAVSIPIYPSLTEAEAKKVVDAIKGILQK